MERWTPFVGERLDTVFKSNNVKDKYVVAIFKVGNKKVIGHLPLRKSGEFAKSIFYFLKKAKGNRC